MPSSESQQRKQRFRESKHAHGGIRSLIDQCKQQTKQLWFREDGALVAWGHDVQPQCGWTTHDFPDDQMEQFVRSGCKLNQFQVIPHDVHEWKLVIKRIRPQTEIQPGVRLVGSEPLASVIVFDRDLYFLQDTTIASPINLWITAHGDPHILYHHTRIQSGEYHKDTQIPLNYQINTKKHSVYTDTTTKLSMSGTQP